LNCIGSSLSRSYRWIPASPAWCRDSSSTPTRSSPQPATSFKYHLRQSFRPYLSSVAVQDFVRVCTTCQRNKSEHLHLVGLLQPLDVPSIAWADITMDFMEGFPCVNNKSVVLTVVDRFSKYGHFIPLGHLYTATTVARAFFDTIVRLHRIPCSIISDWDPVFTSQFWRELFRLAGVKL
jgi:hypothetical protein